MVTLSPPSSDDIHAYFATVTLLSGINEWFVQRDVNSDVIENMGKYVTSIVAVVRERPERQSVQSVQKYKVYF